MVPFTRSIIVEALRLAARPEGATPPELAAVAGCSLRAAQRNLAALAADGALVVVVPERRGKARGAWRNVYRIAGRR